MKIMCVFIFIYLYAHSFIHVHTYTQRPLQYQLASGHAAAHRAGTAPGISEDCQELPGVRHGRIYAVPRLQPSLVEPNATSIHTPLTQNEAHISPEEPLIRSIWSSGPHLGLRRGVWLGVVFSMIRYPSVVHPKSCLLSPKPAPL